jgi:hypothetical protein
VTIDEKKPLLFHRHETNLRYKVVCYDAT